MTRLLTDYFAFASPTRTGCLEIGGRSLWFREGRVVGFDCATGSDSLIPTLVSQGLVSDREARVLEWAGEDGGDAGSWNAVDRLLGDEPSHEVRRAHLIQQLAQAFVDGAEVVAQDGQQVAGPDLGYSALELPYHVLVTLGSERLSSWIDEAGPTFRRSQQLEPALEELGLPADLAQQLHAAGPGVGGLQPPSREDESSLTAFLVMWASGLLESESAVPAVSAVASTAPIGMNTLGGMPRIRPPSSVSARTETGRVVGAELSPPPVSSSPPSVSSSPPPVSSSPPPVSSSPPPVSSSPPPVSSSPPPVSSSPPPVASSPPPFQAPALSSAPPAMPSTRIKPPPTQVVEPLAAPPSIPVSSGRSSWYSSTGVRDAIPQTQDRPAIAQTDVRPALEEDDTDPQEVPEGLPEPIWEAETSEAGPPEAAGSVRDKKADMALVHEILELMRNREPIKAQDKLRESGFEPPRQAIIERYLETLDPSSHDPGGAMNRTLLVIQEYSQLSSDDFVAPLLLSRIYARAGNENLSKIFLKQARQLAG